MAARSQVDSQQTFADRTSVSEEKTVATVQPSRQAVPCGSDTSPSHQGGMADLLQILFFNIHLAVFVFVCMKGKC